MIPRWALDHVAAGLGRAPAVVLLGPRQVGKTTLAHAIATTRPSVYLDLEDPVDRARISDARRFLAGHRESLVVLDEIHRVPDLFAELRGVIDERRRQGTGPGRFLLLGSASLDLLRQSSESLAGRVALVELGSLTIDEVADAEGGADTLWLRGGFPDSFLAASDAASLAWRRDFLRTYLERDLPQFGSRVPAETLRRFWTMLAHEQGALLNAARLAASLGISGQSVTRYLDLMVDLLLVRRLEPVHANVGKRLTRSPKVYIRDSGAVHALLGIDGRDSLLGHPVAGGSWEGLVIESLIAAAPAGTIAGFYRTAAGAEADLVLDLPGGRRWAVEVKLARAPSASRGLHSAVADLRPDRVMIVHGGEDSYPLSGDIEAVDAPSAVRQLRRA